MHPRAGLLVASVAALAALVGCAEDSGDADPGAVPSGSTRPTASSTPPPDAVRTEDLVVPSDLESLAADYNASKKATGPKLGPIRGADVSWPQCPKGMGIPEKQGQDQPMPVEAAEFVIIGLTNSPSFTVNPCLEDQIEWARERDLLVAAYAIVSYPDDATVQKLGNEGPYAGSSRLGALRNVGYQAALHNLRTMKDTGLDSPIVWIDVEPVGTFEWSADTEANAAVVEGTVRGYRDQGLRVGFYSLPSMWSKIVGDLSFEAPEWRPAGENPQSVAEERCGADWSFQGGDAVFGQWVADHRDHNISCPGVRLDRDRWFHKF